MKRFPLALILLLTAFYLPCLGRPAVSDTTNEVPFSFEKGYVIVEARIKSNVPVEVVLSTGAENSAIDAELLEKYKLPSFYAGEPPVTGRNDRIYFFSTVPDVSVGSAKATSLSMRLGSMSEVSRAVGREIFGSLGADFFKGRVVQFDFEAKKVRFLNQSPVDSPQDKKAGGEADGTIVLRMAVSSNLYKPDITVPVVEDVTYDGKKAKTVFDTGTRAVIALSSSATKKLGFAIPPEKGAPRADTVRSLRFGAYEMTAVPVVISAKGTGLDKLLSEYGAVIGSVLLQNFIITFDFRSKVVILKHV